LSATNKQTNEVRRSDL